MDRTSALFMIGCVAATVIVSWIAYPFAVLDEETIAMAKTPQPAELLPDVDVGGGFGTLPVIELMGYYVDNPPAPPVAGAAPAPEIKFGGC